MTNQSKLITKHNTMYVVFLIAYLGWALKSMSQISQYLFIAILCEKCLEIKLEIPAFEIKFAFKKTSFDEDAFEIRELPIRD
jgi:hypothetical protein